MPNSGQANKAFAADGQDSPVFGVGFGTLKLSYRIGYVAAAEMQALGGKEDMREDQMSKKKLGSEEVKKSIEHLIREARICVETEVKINTDQEKGVLGFAAMLTIFPIMISVSEAILGQRGEVNKPINDFATKMKNDNWWLITSPSSPQNIKHDTLVDIRNGLVHAVSLRPRILLTKNITEARVYWDNDPGKYDCIIGIKELIDEVERTVDRIFNDPHYSSKDFDPGATKDFEPIDIIPPPSDYEGDIPTSASGRGT